MKLVILTPYKGASFIAFVSKSDPVYDGTFNGFGTILQICCLRAKIEDLEDEEDKPRP